MRAQLQHDFLTARVNRYNKRGRFPKQEAVAQVQYIGDLLENCFLGVPLQERKIGYLQKRRERKTAKEEKAGQGDLLFQDLSALASGDAEMENTAVASKADAAPPDADMGAGGSGGADGSGTAVGVVGRKDDAQGDADAMAQLGHMFANGLGVKANNQTAIGLFRASAEKVTLF